MSKEMYSNDRKISPLPLEEGAVLHELASARNADEGKKFAQQTVKNLPSYRPNVLTTLVPFKKAAFTLAEVLITLGIIGIVAALTMPTLISNHNKKVWAKGLAKAYSTTAQACRMALAQEGVDSFWDTETGQEMFTRYIHEGSIKHNTYIAKYFQNAELIDLVDNREHMNLYDGSFLFDFGWHVNHGLNFPSFTIFPRSEIHEFMDNPSLGTMSFIVDANGIKKKPNVFGKDIFVFTLNNDCSLKERNIQHSYLHHFSISHISDCYHSSTGNRQTYYLSESCFFKVMQDGWEIKY